MKKPYHLIALLILALAAGCNEKRGYAPENTKTQEYKNWKDSARKHFAVLAYYYNNNIHDSLVEAIPAELEFCAEHELWYDYYDAWMMLGEEYSFLRRTAKSHRNCPGDSRRRHQAQQRLRTGRSRVYQGVGV